MKLETIRLCELELRLARETEIFNGGLHITPSTYNGETIAIRVYNKGYIDSTNNAKQKVKDEWLYTLLIADGIIVHANCDTRYIHFVYNNFVGLKVLPDNKVHIQ
jgi:hypothetical protein